jgi:hypothetical protein
MDGSPTVPVVPTGNAKAEAPIIPIPPAPMK